MKRVIALLMLPLSLTVASCSTTNGPVPALGVNGPTQQSSEAKGLAKIFAESETASRGDTTENDKAQQMLTDGFALVYNNCSDFFYSAGQTQRWLVVTRDTVGTVGTLATSVMALHDASSNAVANLALGTGLTFAGLDIYTKNFLFAAENIDSVRALVTKALIVHRDATLATSPFTYQTATMHILDNQNICTPAAITALVRQAIKKGDVTAQTDDAGTTQNIVAFADRAVLRELGSTLLHPGTLSADQAGAFWWLLEGNATQPERKKFIFPKLDGLPAGSNPLNADGSYQTGWSHEDEVREALLRFSPQTTTKFDAAIASTRKEEADLAAGKKASAPLPPGATPGTVFTLPDVQRSIRSSHISVDIR